MAEQSKQVVDAVYHLINKTPFTIERLAMEVQDETFVVELRLRMAKGEVVVVNPVEEEAVIEPSNLMPAMNPLSIENPREVKLVERHRENGDERQHELERVMAMLPKEVTAERQTGVIPMDIDTIRRLGLIEEDDE